MDAYAELKAGYDESNVSYQQTSGNGWFPRVPVEVVATSSRPVRRYVESRDGREWTSGGVAAAGLVIVVGTALRRGSRGAGPQAGEAASRSTTS